MLTLLLRDTSALLPSRLIQSASILLPHMHHQIHIFPSNHPPPPTRPHHNLHLLNTPPFQTPLLDPLHLRCHRAATEEAHDVHRRPWVRYSVEIHDAQSKERFLDLMLRFVGLVLCFPDLVLRVGFESSPNATKHSAERTSITFPLSSSSPI